MGARLSIRTPPARMLPGDENCWIIALHPSLALCLRQVVRRFQAMPIDDESEGVAVRNNKTFAVETVMGRTILLGPRGAGDSQPRVPAASHTLRSRQLL